MFIGFRRAVRRGGQPRTRVSLPIRFRRVATAAPVCHNAFQRGILHSEEPARGKTAPQSLIFGDFRTSRIAGHEIRVTSH